MSQNFQNYDLSIVIPTHNRLPSLKKLIESISNQETHLYYVEVIVVCNLTDHLVENFLMTLKKTNFDFKLCTSGSLSVNKARNMGMRFALSPLVYFLDDDTILPDNNLLMRVIASQKKYPHAVAIGGGYLASCNSSTLERLYCKMSNSFLKIHSAISDSTPFLFGGNTLYNKPALPDSFNFNEDIIFGGTETELNLRLYNLCFQLIHLDEIDVIHDVKLNFVLFIKKAYMQGKGRYVTQNLYEQKISNELAKMDIADKLILSLAEFFFLEIYNFCFHVGYRNQKDISQLSKKEDISLFITNLIKTFFQVGTNDILNFAHGEKNAFHLKKMPSLRFNEIYHWCKAHLGWRIRVFLLWNFLSFFLLVILIFFWTAHPFDLTSTKFRLYFWGRDLESIFKKIFAS